MSNDDHLPVMAGLAVGIAFIIVMAFVLATVTSRPIFTVDGRDHFRPDRYEHISISIEGLKERYAIGEPLVFSAHMLGYPPNCDIAPSFEIVQSGSNKVMHAYNPLVIGLCDISEFVNNSWTFDEVIDDVALYESGEYNLIVEMYGEVAEKKFVVVSADSGMSVSAEPVPEGTAIEVDIVDSDSSDYSVLPKMSMFVRPPANEKGISFEWEGKIGSYCWGNVCADTAFIVPELLIEVKKGSTIEFQVSNNKQPDELGVIVYKDENNLADRQMTRLSNGEYLVDLPSGAEYVLFVGASWKEGEFSAGSAVYYYRIQVA